MKSSWMPARATGIVGVRARVRVGVRWGSGEGLEGIYRSSLDARKPQNPTKRKEYQGQLQGVLYST
eukprot:9091229-Pyramimonas_sp.AAC.1